MVIKSNNGYLQLYANFENANADLEPSMTDTSSRKALFVYFGDNADSENSASGRVGASLITYLPSTTTTGESTANTDIIPIDPAIQSSFKIGQTIILSEGTNIEETHEVAENGSLKTVDPLVNTHPQGSAITTPSTSTFVDPTNVPTTGTPTDFCDCSNCESYSSGATIGFEAYVVGSDGNYYQCNESDGCTDDAVSSISNQYITIDASDGCTECCPTPTPFYNPCAGLGTKSCEDKDGYVKFVYPFSSPNASGECYPSCDQCASMNLKDAQNNAIGCSRDNGHKPKRKLYRDITNNCEFEECECDERTTNCNNVANGGNANFKSQNIKRNKKVNDECVWDFDLCECLDDDPPQALIDQAQADCLGEPFRDKDNGCNWDFKDIGCNDNIAGGGQTKKDCKEAKLKNCDPAENHKNPKETLDANCDVIPCECLDLEFEGVGIKTCPDGRELSRDANNNCEFPDCEPCDETKTDKADCQGNQFKQMQANCEWTNCKCIGDPPPAPDCGANKQAVWVDVDCEWKCECTQFDAVDLNCDGNNQTIQKNDDDCTQNAFATKIQNQMVIVKIQITIIFRTMIVLGSVDALVLNIQYILMVGKQVLLENIKTT